MVRKKQVKHTQKKKKLHWPRNGDANSKLFVRMCFRRWRKSLIKILGPENVGIHGDIYIIALDMAGWLERPFKEEEIYVTFIMYNMLA